MLQFGLESSPCVGKGTQASVACCYYPLWGPDGGSWAVTQVTFPASDGAITRSLSLLFLHEWPFLITDPGQRLLYIWVNCIQMQCKMWLSILIWPYLLHTGATVSLGKLAMITRCRIFVVLAGCLRGHCIPCKAIVLLQCCEKQKADLTPKEFVRWGASLNWKWLTFTDVISQGTEVFHMYFPALS